MSRRQKSPLERTELYAMIDWDRVEIIWPYPFIKKNVLTFLFLIKIYGITVFKIFIWGGISSDIRSEIKFYGDARAEP